MRWSASRPTRIGSRKPIEFQELGCRGWGGGGGRACWWTGGGQGRTLAQTDVDTFAGDWGVQGLIIGSFSPNELH
jgi:hypothetical protein